MPLSAPSVLGARAHLLMLARRPAESPCDRARCPDAISCAQELGITAASQSRTCAPQYVGVQHEAMLGLGRRARLFAALRPPGACADSIA